jgi:virulence factor Mce-like protein
MSAPPGRTARHAAANPTLVGAIIVLTVIVGVVVSYNANRGLPFVPAYEIAVDVPDAAELIEGGSEVRVGGARVGLVKEIEARPGRGGAPAYARLGLSLEQGIGEVPVDSVVKVRPRSILGAKFLELRPGDSPRTVPPGGTLPLERAAPVVELDEAFNVFDEETARGIQSAVTGLGDGLAGRGAAVNEAVDAAGALMPPLQRVLATLTAPRTGLDRFLTGAAAATGALAPVAPRLGSMLDGGATTLQALDRAGPALERTLDELPPTATVGTRALHRLEPVLADAAAIARDVRPGTRVLARRARDVDRTLRAATPVLGRAPRLGAPLRDTLAALDRLARRPSAPGALRKLIATVTSLDTTLATLNPAQIGCNVGGTWARNLASVFGDSDAGGSWLNVGLVLDLGQMLQSRTQAANLHANPAPVQDGAQCEAGNEPYEPGRRVGSPGGVQHGVARTGEGR